MLTADHLRNILHYNHRTGEFTWRTSPHNIIKAGDAAGTTSHGYRRITIDARIYYSHRLAWLWMTGEWPLAQMDHINLDKADNRWVNLREATNAQNGANRVKPANNSSGFKRVTWNKECRKWGASIQVNKKARYLGLFGTKEEAAAAYAEAAKHYFGEFARCS